MYPVWIGVVSDRLRFGCAARGRGGQASAPSEKRALAAADGSTWGWLQQQRSTPTARALCHVDERLRGNRETQFAHELGRAGQISLGQSHQGRELPVTAGLSGPQRVSASRHLSSTPSAAPPSVAKSPLTICRRQAFLPSPDRSVRPRGRRSLRAPLRADGRLGPRGAGGLRRRLLRGGGR